MNDYESKILEALKQSGEYKYSPDTSTKSREIVALKELEQNGFIRIKSQTIGYCIADVL